MKLHGVLACNGASQITPKNANVPTTGATKCALPHYTWNTFSSEQPEAFQWHQPLSMDVLQLNRCARPPANQRTKSGVARTCVLLAELEWQSQRNDWHHYCEWLLEYWLRACIQIRCISNAEAFAVSTRLSCNFSVWILVCFQAHAHLNFRGRFRSR